MEIKKKERTKNKNLENIISKFNKIKNTVFDLKKVNNIFLFILKSYNIE